MTQVRTKIAKALLITGSAFLMIVAFVIDIIEKSVSGFGGWFSVSREIVVIGAFVLFYIFIESLWKKDQSPSTKLGFALVLSLVVVIGAGLLSLIPSSGFDIKNYTLDPLGFDAILWANVFSVVIGTMAVIVLLLIRDIIFSRRRKGTRRNFLLYLGFTLAGIILTFTMRPLESNWLKNVIIGLTVTVMVMNSFRLTWIVYLSKREKLFSIVYGFLLFCIFVGFDILMSEGMTIGRSIAYQSPALRVFILSVNLFATIYFGMTFISTLFHLPTAEAYDRKASEVSSLHNLSRLVTQVFDFNELVDSVTTMTLEVCEAKSSWLEILKVTPTASNARRLLGGVRPVEEEIETVSRKNISLEDTQTILDGESIRKLVFDSRKSIVIDEVRSDKRTSHLRDVKNKFESMVIVPLVTHEKVIGILYATKDIAFGFDRDDVEVITAFADQATIAIENARLIEKSLERERLMRDMIVAQDMQRKLLPQNLPALDEVELEALSTPAFEVGGDYYDFTMLDEHHLAVLVGDVSGKGVSAAFYMAEMKGIFQSLSRIYRAPKDFLSQAHATLASTIDKRSFISLLYAVLDLRTGIMTVARAGHCPLLHVSREDAVYVKPTGMGLGMGSSEFFEKTISQEQVQLRADDVVVLYTDGVTEAHPKDGDEFGYDRLLEVVQRHGDKSAVEVRDAIIMAVDSHMQHDSPEDDLTLVVMKWRKTSSIGKQ
ncbi:MAG TPA: GAF domain-containing SpoIIE family protein phosphatase [Bacteroidota bacterium]|jgi:serine phosphatase RsbU (regulator of sigma subunit)|nr:GAF domain-containing SpoIIE family protein phosphatase [Bacteroidota bacterium]